MRSVLAAICLNALAVAAQTQITACPTTETKASTADGSQFLICNNSDYQGPSASVIKVASQTECVNICGSTFGCVQAVYDTQGIYCHIKGPSNQLKWTTSTQYRTIRFNGKILDSSKVGKWSGVVKFPVIPVQAFVVPEQPVSNRVLLFSSYAAQDFGGDGGSTAFADYNTKTGALSNRQVTNTNHDMFCPGMSALPDGRLVITGGSTSPATSIYSPKTNAFVRGPDMNIPRGYQTSATLSNGMVFTLGGSYSGGYGGKLGEVYDPAANTWTKLAGADSTPMLTTDAEGIWRTDNHAWLFGWRNGSVFQAGPSKAMHWYNTNGNGAVSDAGTRWTDHDQMCGVHVMYDAGKIFSAGGAQDYTNSDAFKAAFITTIGNPYTTATVERINDMQFARGFGNAVVLPDGTVFISGGQPRSMVFTDTNGILTPELFNPTTKTFRSMANMAVARNYHSVTLLLSDGRVFSGGGGMCYVPYGNSDADCARAADHPDGEFFSPPYLFNSDGSAATRPTLTVSADSVKIGAKITATLRNTATVSFSLLRIGSSTHSINSDQRRISLTSIARSGTTATITLPNDTGLLIPGYYYLFAISSAGVPSIARTLQVTL